jgi:UDP-N-acetylglucosamine 4-epimerase
MTRWTDVRSELRESPRTWLVTGAAGFIGSNLVQELLELDQEVLGLDDLSTGSRANLADVERLVGARRFARFRFHEADVRDLDACRRACEGAPLVLHQAALGSVPRSLADPLTSFGANVVGFAHLLEAAREAGVPRFVYASSSSVYGDHPDLPKREAATGAPLSPYAATKAVDELWAATVTRSFGLPTVGLRYFNVFGPRQDPAGAYAAVVPRWVETLIAGGVPRVFGDGETSRDFCPVANAVQANVLAALAGEEASGRAFNVALGGRTSLLELFERLRDGLAARGVACAGVAPVHEDFRAGDVRHSLADLAESERLLGYAPEVDLSAGVELTLDWYVGRAGRSSGEAAR